MSQCDPQSRTRHRRYPRHLHRVSPRGRVFLAPALSDTSGYHQTELARFRVDFEPNGEPKAASLRSPARNQATSFSSVLRR
jgi:hypothetical protein